MKTKKVTYKMDSTSAAVAYRRMHAYILTPKEREIAQALVENDLKIHGFKMLKNRAQRAFPRIEKDFQLLKKFLEKSNKE